MLMIYLIQKKEREKKETEKKKEFHFTRVRRNA